MRTPPLLPQAFLCLTLFVYLAHAEVLQCSCSPECDPPALDASLQEMQYDLGFGPQTFRAYVTPDIHTMYLGQYPPASTLVTPKFEGFSTKFINMSPRRVQMHWVPPRGDRPPSPMSMVLPFHAAGTSSFPGHEFIFTDPDDVSQVYHRFIIKPYPDNLQVYDPIQNDQDALSSLSQEERQQYEQLRLTLEFSKQYQNFTGRAYLADYLRSPPNHFIWPALHFNQTHWVETLETHFTTKPPASEVQPITAVGKERRLQDGEPRLLQDYRTPDTNKLNMTLRVLSVSPRVFEIPNFLSATEVQHILEIAGAVELARSTVGNVEKDSLGASKKEVKSDTRTSTNSWVERARSPIIDAIYRRAADLLRMDEALLRDRGDDEGEIPNLSHSTKITIAEHLQLVHYDPGQEYVAHHDFGYRDLKSFGQKARFATLLLYLNHEGLEGGETTFPRWQNAETFLPLKVKPEAGKAVLFYSQLPDGNFDDFSQHSAEKPRDGEKWLINLWTWAPYKD